MLITPTLEQLRSLGLTGMARALTEQLETAEYQALNFEERLGMLVDRESQDRANRRLERNLKAAKLRHQATLGDIDFRASVPRPSSHVNIRTRPLLVTTKVIWIHFRPMLSRPDPAWALRRTWTVPAPLIHTRQPTRLTTPKSVPSLAGEQRVGSTPDDKGPK